MRLRTAANQRRWRVIQYTSSDRPQFEEKCVQHMFFIIKLSGKGGSLKNLESQRDSSDNSEWLSRLMTSLSGKCDEISSFFLWGHGIRWNNKMSKSVLWNHSDMNHFYFSLNTILLADLSEIDAIPVQRVARSTWRALNTLACRIYRLFYYFDAHITTYLKYADVLC